jgi:hypothetical protein
MPLYAHELHMLEITLLFGGDVNRASHFST